MRNWFPFGSLRCFKNDPGLRISLALHELHNAFSSLKFNKWPGYDDISSNIIEAASSEVFSTIKHLSNISLQLMSLLV